ncbi:MAG: hypothetical protein IH965_13535 [Gemmatimonadetes bacterium]|nr:hypothetical protein [Gemmatimonadota bacterium]
MNTAPVSHRGVWIAPWMDTGRTVLYVMDSHSMLVIGPIMVPFTADAGVIADGLWDLLDVADPQGSPPPPVSPVFRRAKKGKGRTPLSLVE